MNERMLLAVPIALGALALAAGPSAAQQLYRWVDKEGGVHYTQSPPPPGAAKSLQQRKLSASVVETSGASYAMQMATRNFPVALYVQAGCGAPCQDAQNHLKKRGVPFREVSVSSAAEIEELKKIAGSFQVPVMTVGSQALLGFEPGQWKSALDLAGYPASAPPQTPPRPAEARPARAAGLPAIPVKLYTNSQCGSPCAEAKQFLAARGVGFEEVAVETPATFEELRKLTGGAKIPVLAVGEQVVTGFQPGRWTSAMDKAGFPPDGARVAK